MTPLLHNDSSKPEMFANIKKAAAASNNDVKAFREGIMSERTQELLSRSKESYEKDRDLSKANSVAVWGWIKDDE